jgi:VanZ family protein
LNSFLKYNLPSFIWAAIILWLCLSSGSGFPRITIPNFDKVVHFTFYFVLTILMFYGWMKQQFFPMLHRQTFLRIFLIAVAYGASIEIMQELFTSTRHFELLDIAANSTGAIMGSLLSVKLFK